MVVVTGCDKYFRAMCRTVWGLLIGKPPPFLLFLATPVKDYPKLCVLEFFPPVFTRPCSTGDWTWVSCIQNMCSDLDPEFFYLGGGHTYINARHSSSVSFCLKEHMQLNIGLAWLMQGKLLIPCTVSLAHYFNFIPQDYRGNIRITEQRRNNQAISWQHSKTEDNNFLL